MKSATLPSYLALPAYATSRHAFPKHSCRVTIVEEPRLLRRLMPCIQPEISIGYRDSAIANARECFQRAAKARNAASRAYGDSGGLNRFPVSAGLCNHWPEETKNEIRDLVHLHQDWSDVARAWHAYAGKRPATFPDHFTRPNA